jgi:hypothetical protein
MVMVIGDQGVGSEVCGGWQAQLQIVIVAEVRVVIKVVVGILMGMLRQNAVQCPVLQVFGCAGMCWPSQRGQRLQHNETVDSEGASHGRILSLAQYACPLRDGSPHVQPVDAR